MPNSSISYLWRDQKAPRGFRTGVSLHSHTNQSQETLDFLANFGNQYPLTRPLMSRLERRSEADSRDAHQLCGQLLDAADDPQAGLRSGKQPDREARPGADGLHHRPRQYQGAHAAAHGSQRAPAFRSRWSGARPTAACSRSTSAFTTCPAPGDRVDGRPSTDFTANPSDARLTEILAALDKEPNVLVVFNHPMWDLYMIGKEKHEFLVNEFLQKNGAFLHALELNGLRHWDENRAVRRLARNGTCCSSPAATATAWSPTPIST